MLTKNKSALISGASRAIQDVIDPKVVEQEERIQMLSARGKATMFQTIDDEIQLQTHDPHFEDVETDIATSAREHHMMAQNNASKTQQHFAEGAQDGIF